MNDQLEIAAELVVACLRCGRLCRTGIPDPKARAIRRGRAAGFCPDCIITFFLLSIEPIRDTIEGMPACASHGAIEGKGPEILLAKHVRDGWAPILRHTQLKPEEINWIEVVGNWYLPWPKGKEPQVGANF